MRGGILIFVGFIGLLLTTVAQGAGGKAVTPAPPRLGPEAFAGLSPSASYLLLRLGACAQDVSRGRTPLGARPTDAHPTDCSPEWRDAFEALTSEGKTPERASQLLTRLMVEAIQSPAGWTESVREIDRPKN
jgi:hypothetical protein